MSLKIIQNFDAIFTLNPQEKEVLFTSLTGDEFLQQIAEQGKCDRVEFTYLIFQPVPYSAGTPKGMPAEFEQYYQSPDHLIINVPPNFMFAAKIFHPSRLCAIYQKVRHGE